MIRYKVVEISTVADAEIEEVLNEWTELGWNFDGLHFAMRDSSKRPSMAFAVFTKNVGPDDDETDNPTTRQDKRAKKTDKNEK